MRCDGCPATIADTDPLYEEWTVLLVRLYQPGPVTPVPCSVEVRYCPDCAETHTVTAAHISAVRKTQRRPRPPKATNVIPIGRRPA